jgi:hypothetical protein
VRPGPFRPLRAAAIALSSALALASCGSKPPEVAAVEWRLESRPAEKGSSFESLSAFGSIKDEDGIDNIVELWIVNDAEALAWKLTNAEWTKASEGGDNWIGGSALAMPELGSLPRGEYKLIAIDAAGQRAELAFAVAGSFPSRSAPTLSYAKDRLAIRSDWPETLILAFDATGALLASVAAPQGSATPAEAFGQSIAPRAEWACAYGYEPALKMGAFSTRIKTR